MTQPLQKKWMVYRRKNHFIYHCSYHWLPFHWCFGTLVWLPLVLPLSLYHMLPLSLYHWLPLSLYHWCYRWICTIGVTDLYHWCYRWNWTIGITVEFLPLALPLNLYHWCYRWFCTIGVTVEFLPLILPLNFYHWHYH